MEFKDVISNRFSCKKYADRSIEKEKLISILEAGRLAPTAKNLQEQHIYVVSTKENLEKIDKATPCRYGAPCVLIVAYDRNNTYHYPNGKQESGAEDATIVATHMILAARNEGIDSCWLNCFDADVVKSEFALPENEEVVMLMDLGYGEMGPLQNHENRKDLSETVTWL